MNRRSCSLTLAISLLSLSALGSPRFVRVNGSVSQGAPDAAARHVVSQHIPLPAGSTLELTRSQLAAGARRVVKLGQRHRGVRVLGRGAGVVFAPDGRARFAAIDLARTFTSEHPAIDRAAATQRVAKRHPSVFRSSDAELAWLPQDEHARLVWMFYRGALAPLPLAPLVMVDAATGRIVLDVNAIVFDRAANVFEHNPVATPEPITVTLSSLPDGATTLTTNKLAVYNCIDKQTLGKSPFDFHVCETEQRALSDESGDFFFEFPGNTAPEDEYAEATVFYHLSKAYDFFAHLGMPELEAKPLNTFVNLRMPPGWSAFDLAAMQNVKLPLEPYNNAFYAADNPFGDGFGPPGTGIWFGQGKSADFAYDGDVVYHEFGHAMVDRTIDLVPYWHLDEYGASPSPGAMNEGLADYFSSALTGDGQVGEYAGQNILDDITGASIRNLDNDDTCPKNLSGEVHTDSTFFSGALWSVRQGLPPSERYGMDAAVLTALMTAPSGDLGYEQLAELIALALEDSLGLGVAAVLRNELTSRGVLPRCQRVLVFEGAPLMGPEMRFSNAFFAPGRPKMGLDEDAAYAPGLLQIHWKLPEDAQTLRVNWGHLERQSQSGFGPSPKPYDPALLVQFEDQPITFTYDPTVSSSAGEPVPVVRIGDTYRGEIAIPAGATDVYLMIVNRGDREALYNSVSLSVPVEKPSTGGTAGMTGIGGDGGVGGSAGQGGISADPQRQELTPAGGCSVTSNHRNASGWLAALALAMLGWRRRRASLKSS